jgi:2-phosphoglycerate kinase
MARADRIDRSMTKHEIRDYLLEQARQRGVPMSKSRANNLADKYKKGGDLRY